VRFVSSGFNFASRFAGQAVQGVIATSEFGFSAPAFKEFLLLVKAAGKEGLCGGGLPPTGRRPGRAALTKIIPFPNNSFYI
jgi:hypothetical protein